jgi:predicted transcriptional regulator of viral defense system
VANQVLQTVYYYSARARKDVVFDRVTYHQVASPRALATPSHRLFQTELVADNVLVTERERSLVDCLLFLDYSGGVEELDKSLAMFRSFDFDAALAYLKLLRRPWLYSRLGFLLDRHADKRPGNHWVPTWRLMVLDTLSPTRQIRCEREIRPGTNHKTYA